MLPLGPLMLTCLLCVADSLCPSELNPLTLDPPELVAEHGEPVMVNCTSTEEDHEGMYWTLPGNPFDSEEEKNFVSFAVNRADWGETAECRIKINESVECSKDLKLTLYKAPDNVSISAPSVQMVQGSTYPLNCHIINVAPVQRVMVTWSMGTAVLKIQTFSDPSVTPVNLSTTQRITAEPRHHGAVLTCEAELQLGPGGPELPPVVISTPYTLDVHYAPELKDTSDNVVDEGSNVTLTCDAEGNPPPAFYWTSEGRNLSENTNKLTITSVTSSAIYSCTATNYLGSKTKNITIRVVKITAATTSAATTPHERAGEKVADSLCPSELNPLTLDPPELVAEHGEPVMVNCTSTEEDHEGMYWTLPGNPFDSEEEKNFVSFAANQADWGQTAECRIKINESFECSKDLKITLYKAPDNVSISAPSVQMVQGSTYPLNCHIINVAPVQRVMVTWSMGTAVLKIQTFSDPSVTPVNLSSTQRITAEPRHHGAVLTCEAELQLGPGGPELPPVVISTPYTLDVHYAPELKDTSDTVVDEGSNVTLTCDAEGNPPPAFYWTSEGRNMSENTNKLTITSVTSSAIYSCTATNYLGSKTKNITIHVVKITAATTSAATTPHERAGQKGCPLSLTPAEVVVEFGAPASINCSTSATDALGMGWEAPFGGTGFQTISAVTWAVENVEQWSVKPKCYMTSMKNEQCFVIPDITVYKTPDTVSISGSKDVTEDSECLLSCDITNVAPVRGLIVKWYRGNETMHTETFNGTAVTPVNVSSTLRFTAERRDHGAAFTCRPELQLGPGGPESIPAGMSESSIAVLYKPLLEDCPGRYAGVEHEFSLDMFPCQADGNPPPSVHWFYKGTRVNASEPLNRMRSGKYTAEAVNVHGVDKKTVDITIEYAPSLICDDLYEVREDGQLQNVCDADGLPPPVITWVKDGGEMPRTHRWKKHDSGNYSLSAANKHGAANQMLYVNVLYAPVFRKGNYTEEVTPGGNVTFNCHAEGNPAPEIHWDFASAENVMETTGGRQRNISVTGATSTNAGVYICAATNRVGRVTRTVTLLMKGKTRRAPLSYWWLLIPLIVAIIIILILIYRKWWKKHGQYSFVPDKANDGSDRSMPMIGMEA